MHIFYSNIFVSNFLTIKFVIANSDVEITLQNRNDRKGIDSEDNSRGDFDRNEQEVDWLAQPLLLLPHQITFDRISEGLFTNVAQQSGRQTE